MFVTNKCIGGSWVLHHDLRLRAALSRLYGSMAPPPVPTLPGCVSRSAGQGLADWRQQPISQPEMPDCGRGAGMHSLARRSADTVALLLHMQTDGCFSWCIFMVWKHNKQNSICSSLSVRLLIGQVQHGLCYCDFHPVGQIFFIGAAYTEQLELAQDSPRAGTAAGLVTVVTEGREGTNTGTRAGYIVLTSVSCG